MMNMNNRRDLVISTVGDQSLHRYWMPQEGHNFDLMLIYYGDGEGYEKDTPYYMKRKGPKYHLLDDAIRKHPEILQYRYIWMPDDDIALDADEIQRLFDISREYKLWISQPSIMGWYGLNVTLHHKDCFLRYTNYVEIMCPCFESRTLSKCLGTFRENKTGWGIDHVWNQILDHPTNKIAVIDDVVAYHTRPVGGGDTYKNQTKTGAMSGALEENDKVHEKYDIAASSYKDLKSGHLCSAESFGMLYHNTVEYGRVYKQLEAGVDVSKRIWPPSPQIEGLCETLRSGRPKEAT